MDQQEQVELQGQMTAMMQEYERVIAMGARRAATLLAELAATQAKLAAAEAQLKEIAEKVAKKKGKSSDNAS